MTCAAGNHSAVNRTTGQCVCGAQVHAGMPSFTQEQPAPSWSAVSAVLDASAVAWWSEVLGELTCRQCRRESRVISWQGVTAEDMNTLAKELGMTTCSRCHLEIGHA